MTDRYHINLEDYSLTKFQLSLENRKMIPSRVILKEQLKEKFEILNSNGLKNLKSLNEALKTKQKIEAFSNQSGISIDYLIVLKREVNSYLPSPRRLKDFPGVDSKVVEALEKIGVKNTRQLFNQGRNSKKIKQLAQQSDIATKKMEELVSFSDLARLYGVGPTFARILYDAGIRSVKDFLKHSPESIISVYEENVQKKADFSISDITISLEIAEKLESKK